MRFTDDAQFDGSVTTGKVDLVNAALSSSAISVNIAVPVLFDSFAATGYRSAEYLVQLTQSGSHAMTKFLVIHDGTDVGISEYGYVGVGSPIDYAVDAAISQGDLELTIAFPTANINTVTMKHSRVLFDI